MVNRTHTQDNSRELPKDRCTVDEIVDAATARSAPENPAVAPGALRQSLTTWRLILLVIAAAAPMAAVVGIVGTVGVMTLQCLASLAVIGYFRRHGGRAIWPTLIAPLLAFLAMGFGVVLAVRRFDLISGASNAIANGLPIVVAVAFAVGAGYGSWVKLRRSDRYRAVTTHLATEPQP